MNRFIVLISLGLPCLAGAHQLRLLPDSCDDGVTINAAGVNGAQSRWGSSSTLGAYEISGDAYQNPLHPESSDHELGLTWNYSVPASLSADRQLINSNGGIVRAIFIGETAGWLNNFGYTYSGHSSGPGAFTAWKQIQSFGAASNIKFGEYFDVTLEPGQMDSFDFWFSATGSFGSRPKTLTSLGGVYMAFNSAGGSNPTHQYLWSESSISVNTWIPSISADAPVATYLAGIEDWRIGRGSDGDYNDFLFAVQFYNTDGTPLTVVPEPGTWAAIAGASALCLVFMRRYRLRQID